MNQYDIVRKKISELECCVLIPTYNNDKKLEGVIQDVLQYTNQIIIVNDGSTDNTREILDRYPQIEVVSYNKNVGKGWALRKGMETAGQKGFRYALSIDSDGQHSASDFIQFLDVAEKNPDALIVGARNIALSGMPDSNSFANKFSNFWFWLETGTSLPDTQSGFRLYPLKAIGNFKFYTSRYEFELEVLVRSAWKGIPILSVPIKVEYPEDRITHFRKFRDFTRISLLNTVLVLITFLYVKPVQFFSNFKKENRREFIRKNILFSNEPNIKISLAITLGIFIGIAPIWGYQIMAGIMLAHLLKLNKVLVVVASHISIPPMIPLIIYASYKMGAPFVENPREDISYTSGLSLEIIKSDMLQYVIGSLILGAGLAILMGIISYIVLIFIRKRQLIAQ